MLSEMAHYLVDAIESFGYLGIFLLMAVESSFIPFPSEIIMIPAGYSAAQGHMNVVMVLLSGAAGSMLGAFINYYLARTLGRSFLYRYGHYFFMKNATLDKMQAFFLKHGPISTFTGRLIPGIRQLISIPAGLAKMKPTTFALFTFLGAFIWLVVLVSLGYFVGENEELFKKYLHQILYVTLALLVVMIAIYVWFQKKNARV